MDARAFLALWHRRCRAAQAEASPQDAIAGPWRRIAGFLRPTQPPPGMTTKQPKKVDAYNPENPAYNKNTRKSSK